jgi:hypothetical protein
VTNTPNVVPTLVVKESNHGHPVVRSPRRRLDTPDQSLNRSEWRKEVVLSRRKDELAERTTDGRKLAVVQAELKVVNLLRVDGLSERFREGRCDGVQEDGVVVRGNGEGVGKGGSGSALVLSGERRIERLGRLGDDWDLLSFLASTFI